MSNPVDQIFVVTAFDLDESGVLIPSYKPAQPESEKDAIALASALAGKHAGVIAWSKPAGGTTKKVLFQRGDVGELE
ncbi:MULTISPECIES: hypothetical protein [Mesorhizobium]|uniref:hypothetical protein n=1 Tax=Mesorhizobium TaxID=68287 RepID=UPI0010A9626B|nr:MULTISPECIES: hypothetical protein [Mesorhizobium]